MKSLTLLILILALFNYINSTCAYSSEDDTNYSPEYRDGEDCSKRGFSEEETENNYSYCCLLKYEKETSNIEEYGYSCIPLTAAQYDDIDTYIDQLEETNEKNSIDFTVKELDCKSNYLKSFLLLSVLVLF